MAKDNNSARVKKRKRSSSSLQPPSSGNNHEQDAPTANLLQFLTGADEHVQPTPSKKDNKEEPDKNTTPPKKPKQSSVINWQNPIHPAHAGKVKVTVLLESANLEAIRQYGRSGGMVLLNCDDHRHILEKTNRQPNDARPDITHQCLLTLLDSPLNKAGRLKIYIRTAKNALIEVHPDIRIPRTIKRFSGLMTECLDKFKIRGTSGSTPLLRVIKNPITSHLPVGTRKIVCTYNTENVVDMRQHAAKMSQFIFPEGTEQPRFENDIELKENGEEVNVMYVVGAMAHGKITEDWADDYICVSNLPLSASTVCSRITYAYECLFGIL